MTFTPDHVRCLAAWCERLGLVAYQAELFGLYHRMRVNPESCGNEEIVSLAMGAIQVIGSNEPDRAMFYQTMNAWGIR